MLILNQAAGQEGSPPFTGGRPSPADGAFLWDRVCPQIYYYTRWRNLPPRGPRRDAGPSDSGGPPLRSRLHPAWSDRCAPNITGSANLNKTDPDQPKKTREFISFPRFYYQQATIWRPSVLTDTTAGG